MKFKGIDAFSVNSNIVWREVDNELVLVNLDNGYYYTLNDSARVIWEVIAKEGNIDAVKNELIRVYDIAVGTVEKDIDTTLDGFVAEKLITVKEKE